MAPTTLTVAVGILVGAALLGAAFDRRSILIVAVVAALPGLDAVVSLALEGATNAAFHTLFIPLAVAVAVYWDTERREQSWLRSRYGWWGVRVTWVSIAAYVVAGIGLALFVGAGANLFYPLHDRFYLLEGRLLVSTHEGIVQTYVTLGGDGLLEVASPGTTGDYHVTTWLNPTPGTGLESGVERELRFVEAGWQAVVIVTAIAVLAVKLWAGER